jgi:putative peptide zinc metalloprotease protein
MDVNLYKPIIVKDVSYWLLYNSEKNNVYSVGSISKDRYIEVKETLLKPILLVIKCLNGKNTINQIKNQLLEKHNIDIDVKNLIELLLKSDLIENNYWPEKIEKQEFDKFFYKLIKIPISSWSKYLANLSNKFKIFIYSINLIIFLGIISFVINFNVFFNIRNYQISNSYIYSIAVTLPIFIFSFTIHELGHATMAVKYGLRPKDLIIGFYASLSGMIYLKIPGLYTINWLQVLNFRYKD